MAKFTGTENADVIGGKSDEGNDIYGLGGNDTLTGGYQSDSIDGGDGDDLILSGGGIAHVLRGGAGNDKILSADYPGSKTYNLIDGGAGDDYLTGGISDTLIGGDGADTIEAEYGADARAGAGDDVVHVGLYQSTLDGGDGIDRLVAKDELSLASFKNFEILEVDEYLGVTVEELQQFSSIRSADPGSIFSLGVAGSADLSSKLGNSSVVLSLNVLNGALASGEGNDVLYASYGGNASLDGRGGNDTLDGLDATSTLIGGAGDDEIKTIGSTFLIDGGIGDDLIRVSANVVSGDVRGGTGYDQLIASGDISKATISGVEALASENPLTATAVQFESFEKISGVNYAFFADLRLAAAGALDLAEELGKGNASITGSTGADAITSGAGADTLLGGEGNDTIHGGAGSDLVIVESGADHVFGDAGDDIIELRDYVGAVIDGGAGKDTLSVFETVDSGPIDLSASTVTGVETLYGNSGEIAATAAQFESFDSITNYYGQIALRVIGGGALDLSDELADQAVTFAGSEVDDAVRTGAGNDTIEGGNGGDRLDGSDGKDKLLGGNGVDTLIGGAGRDRLDGGQDGDLYIVDDASDDIRDTGFKGIDTVASSVTIRLDKSAENLKLTGAADIDGTGNGGDNVLTGNSGDNHLDGGKGADTLYGGDGADQLDGGQGGDLYFIDDVLDRIADTGSTGVDMVAARVSYQLVKSVENLKLTAAADIDGTGNALANLIVGNKGDNGLDGLSGADTLQGGKGDDVFQFTTKLGAKNVDQIVDFNVKDDDIGLDRDAFDGLAKGAFKAAAFKDVSTGDVDANDRILYDSKSGKLFYDADGSGSSKAVLFAELKAGQHLSADDFQIV